MQMYYKERLAAPFYGKRCPNNGIMTYYNYSGGFADLKSVHFNWIDQYYQNPESSSFVHVWVPGYDLSQRFGSTRRKRPEFNDCHNTKTTFMSLPFSWQGSNRAQAFTRAHLTYSPLELEQLVNYQFPNVDFYIQRARMRGTCNMVPQFEPYVEMLNFLFELKDFRDIVKQSKAVFTPKNRKIAENVWEKVNKRKQGVPASKSPSKDIAGGWLFYQFAVSPLFKDMSDILDGLAETSSEAYKKYKEKGLKPSSMHYREVLHSDNELVREPSYPGYYYADRCLRREVVFNSTIEMTYKAPDLDPMEVMKDAWGLRFTPGVVWNGAKFTFLLDYFVRIGKALEQSSRYNNRPLMNIIRMCESVERIKSAEVTLNGGYLWNEFCIDGKIIKPVEVKPRTHLTRFASTEYVRSLAQPSYCMPLPVFKLPSGKQGLNMLALARVFL